MANQLLNRAGLEAQARASIQKEPDMAATKNSKLDDDSRCFLYSPDAPAGQLFVGKEAIQAAKKKGWVDSPAKVDGEDPGDAGE